MKLKIIKNYLINLNEDEYKTLIVILGAYYDYAKSYNKLTEKEIRLMESLHLL